jgi:hypothetical protein
VNADRKNKITMDLEILPNRHKKALHRKEMYYLYSDTIKLVKDFSVGNCTVKKYSMKKNMTLEA